MAFSFSIRRIPGTALLAGAIMFASCGPPAPPEQVYVGKTIPQWMDRLRQETEEQRIATFDEISSHGREGLLLMLRLLEARNPDISRRAYSETLEQGPAIVPELVKIIESPNGPSPGGAALILGEFGSDSAPAAEALVVALSDPGKTNSDFSRTAVARALGQIGPAVIPPLAAAVQHPAKRSRCLDVLVGYGLLAIPELERRAEADPDFAEEARRIAASIRLEAYRPLDMTIAWLSNPERQTVLPQAPVRSVPGISEETFDELKLNGLTAGEAVDRLVGLVRSSRDPTERRKSAETLRRFGPLARESLPEMLRLLESEDSHLRMTATEVIGVIGPEARDAFPGLQAMLERGGAYDQIRAVWAMSQIGSPCAPAVPSILRMVDTAMADSEDAELATQRIRVGMLALANIDPAAAVPPAAKLLGAKKWSHREAGAQALLIAGEEGLPALREAMASTDTARRMLAIATLLRMGRENEMALLMLQSAAGSDDSFTKWAIQEADRQMRLPS